MTIMRRGQLRVAIFVGILGAALAAAAVSRDSLSAAAPNTARPAAARPVANSDHRSTIAIIERILPGVEGEPLRWALELAHQHELEFDHQHKQALDNARRLLADRQTSSAQHELLLDRVAFNLFNLDRVEEGIACYNRQLLDAIDHPAERLRLLEAKAQMLLSHVEPARGIPAWREFRRATMPNSPRWETATAMLALELARDSQHAEAIALRSELVEHYRQRSPLMRASLLVEIAKSQRALGQSDRAHQSLDEAEAAFPANSNAAANQDMERLQEQIARVRQSMPVPRIRESKRHSHVK